MGEDAKFDEEFWNAEMFKEEGEDELYFTESESEDEVDEDFDAPEPTEAEVAAAAVTDEKEALEVEKKKPQTKRYVDPERQKPRSKGKAKVGDLEESPKPAKTRKRPREPRESEHEAATAEADAEAGAAEEGAEEGKQKEGEGPPKSRKSSRSLTVKKMQEGKQRRIEEQEVTKKRRKRPSLKAETRALTQEEVLAEAKETEKINLALLEEMLKLEAKQKPVIRKQRVVEGPAISFVSTPKGNLLSFTQVNQLPDVLRQSPIAYPPRPVCVITGLPAKYKDPKTGLWYSTPQAFKALRERYGTSEQQMMEVETTPAPESPVKSTTPVDEPVASEKKEPAARPKRRKSTSSTSSTPTAT